LSLIFGKLVGKGKPVNNFAKARLKPICLKIRLTEGIVAMCIFYIVEVADNSGKILSK